MYIPFRIRLLHNFGRSSFIIGFLFALIGVAFIAFFGSILNWKLLLAEEEDFSRTEAIISEIQETRYSVNDNFLFEYYYTYSFDNESLYSGSFLEYEGAYYHEQKIKIEYLSNSPAISRFSGKDRRNFDQTMFLAGIGGSLIGFFFLVPSIRKTRKERKILITGRPARGKLIHAEPTNLSVNEQTVYKLIFEYSTGNNKSQQFSTRSHLIRNLSEEHFQTLIYDPGKPDSAVVIDTLPGPVARYVTQNIDPSLN